MHTAKLLLISLFIIGNNAIVQAKDTYILANDPSIQYTGRIDFSNPKAPTFSFPGISIKANFFGTYIRAVIKDYGLGGETSTNYYDVVIDEVVISKLKVLSSDTLYLVCDGLSNAVHSVELIKRTESSVGKSSFLGFVIQGNSLVAPPSLPNLKFEFIGDSWTCGYGNEISTTNPNTGFHSVNEDNMRAWGYIIAKKFNAQYMATSISGRGLYRNNTGTTNGVVPDEYDKIFPGQSLPLWNFSNYIPDIVVIHLGTNDFYPETVVPISMLDSAAYVTKYIDFITTIRANYGNGTKIICAFGNSKSDWWPVGLNHLTRWRNYVTAAVNHLNGLGDSKVYKVELTVQNAPYGEDWHPTIVTHNQMANEMASYISTITDLVPNNYQASTTVLAGTSNLQVKKEFRIFPVPTSGSYTISGCEENTEWEIYDAHGALLKHGKGNSGTIEEYDNGVYYLSIQNQTIKLLKF